MGRRDRAAARMKVAYYSPLPPERSGHRRLQRAAPAGAAASELDVVVPARGQTKPPRGTELSVYHVGNNPDVHGWIVDALRRTPGRRRAARLRAAPPRRRAHARAQGRRGLPERDGARRRPPRPPARARGRRRLRPAALVDASGGLPARGRGARSRARARPDRPLRPRPRARARRGLRRADLEDPHAGLA